MSLVIYMTRKVLYKCSSLLFDAQRHLQSLLESLLVSKFASSGPFWALLDPHTEKITGALGKFSKESKTVGDMTVEAH